MSEGDKDKTAAEGAGGDEKRAPAAPETGLARPLQEHLAQKLRSAYQELAQKPAFLGDPAVPTEFEQQLRRLEEIDRARHAEKVRHEGIEAVKTALEEIVASPLDPEESTRDQERRQNKR